MKILHVTVRDKIATYSQRDGAIVCGNDDYQVQFTLGPEWDGVPAKARFIWNGQHKDEPIEDGIAKVPRIVRAREVKVGVYSDDESLYTTTSARIPCEKSILCDTTNPTEGNEAYYASEAQKAAERAEEAAERAEAAGGGGGTVIDPESVNQAREAAAAAKASAEEAATSATNAQQSRDEARAAATNAGDSAARAEAADTAAEQSAENAAQSWASAENAKNAANKAKEAAEVARDDANDAQASAEAASDTASQKATEATNAAQTATTAADNAGKAKTAAETAKSEAQALKNEVEDKLANGDYKGEDGQRGTGILKVSTSPTSYTTSTNGISPIKRMSISTVMKEAGVSEVLVGDCICHSYYLYHIYYVDSTYAYMDKSQSIRGATGSNGSDGAAGADGKSAYEYAKDGGYTGTEEEFTAELACGVQTVDTRNPLCGKRVVFDGDSICAPGTDKPSLLGAYAGRIKTRHNMEMANYAVGGGTITAEMYASDGKTARHWISRNIDTIHAEHPALDYLIIEGGTNDADLIGDITGDTTPTKFGTYADDDYSGDYDDTTFCGAVESLFFKALSYYPKANIGVIIPMQMGYRTSASKNRRAYFDVLIKMCRKWAIPYIDLWRTSQMNANLPVYYDATLSVAENTAQKYYQDGQHPTSRGYALLTPRIEAWMANISANDDDVEPDTPDIPDVPAYTNLVPMAIDTNGSIFNGVGYQNGKYLSSSNWNNLSDSTDSVATGYIPYRLNDDGTAPVIYVKGVTVSTASHCRMATYGGESINFGVMCGTYGSTGTYAWGTYFAFEQIGDAYYKITCLNSSMVKEYVRFSFIGSGENLIVTVDQKIK